MDDRKLIELVREYPELYDKSNSKYTYKELKNLLWSKIGEQMKLDGVSCKNRWRNISNDYKASLKRNQTVSGENMKDVKPYKYAEQLSFLKLERETKREEGETFASDDDVDDSLSCKNEKNTRDCTDGTFTEQSAQNSTLPETVAGSSSMNSSSQDTIDEFLLSIIAPVLKKLSARSLYSAKKEIYSLIQDYEYSEIMNQERNASSSQSASYSTSQRPFHCGERQQATSYRSSSFLEEFEIVELCEICDGFQLVL